MKFTTGLVLLGMLAGMDACAQRAQNATENGWRASLQSDVLV